MCINEIEADLYLNVDSTALECIIKYIQTNKLDRPDNKCVNEIIDLATMFGMPELVKQMREMEPSKDDVDRYVDLYCNIFRCVMMVYKEYVGDSEIDVEKTAQEFREFVSTNIDNFRNDVVRPNIEQSGNFHTKCLGFLLCLLVKNQCRERPHPISRPIPSFDLTRDQNALYLNEPCDPMGDASKNHDKIMEILKMLEESGDSDDVDGFEDVD